MHPDGPLLLAVVALAGVAAGFVNSFAGGGSLLTLPALMLVGLPAHIANGTNRLAVVTQSVSGVWAFHRHGKLDRAAIVPVLAPTLLGSAAGALLAAIAPSWLLEPVLLGTMVAVAAGMAVTGRRRGPDDADATAERPPGSRLLRHGGLFLAGLYGGFIQAGVGFVLLAVLAGPWRHDLVRANALKLVCTLVFGVVALGVFSAAGQIAWGPAVVLAVSTVAGSLLGVRFAVRVAPHVLRWIILACVVATSAAALLR